MILETLKTKKIYIVGAQSRAKTLKGYIAFLYPDICIEAFLVDNLSDNDEIIDGIPVKKLEDGLVLDNRLPVFIATKGIYHAEIIDTLKRHDMLEIIPVTVQVDNELRNAYVKKFFATQGADFIKIEELEVGEYDFSSETDLQARVYVAKSIYDRPLQTEYGCADYEEEIQVGAALTTQRLGEDVITDNVGENISEKNRQYCELTALYWLWKNRKEDDVIGLAHYRRHFVLPVDWKERMIANGVDIILPVPTYVSPSITANYKERHDPVDWEYLLDYLKKHENNYCLAQKVFDGNLYSPCNMFIARREVVEELCEWMFPILDAVVAHGGVKEDTYLNRYPGFVSERLFTLFIEKNREKYNIVYADKTFLA